MTREERNEKILAGLHLPFALLLRKLLSWADGEGKKLLFVQGRRTFSEQAALYSQGRTTDGRKVTNARAGWSFHNYGLAVDFVDVAVGTHPDGFDDADWNETDYAAVAAEARRLGMEWGGAWRSFQDRPHLEFHPGYATWEAIQLASLADPEGHITAPVFV